MNTLFPTAARSGQSSMQFRKAAIAIAVATACASSAMSAESVKAPAEEGLSEVVVTGSRIVRRDFSSPSPIVTVGADALQNSADVSIDQALSKLPQFNPGANQFNQAFNVQATASSSPGAATVNLRGLGPNRNLVLLDGRRAQPADASLAVDVNTIPQAAIESVEIVTGGAGATYGADALAGVVNFRLKKRFQGIELDAQYGETAQGDNKSESVSALIGGNLGDDRGNVMLGLTYANRGSVLVKDHAFFAAANTDPNTPAAAFFANMPGFNQIPYIPGSFTPASGFFWNLVDQGTLDSIFAAKGYPAGTVSSFGPLNFQPGATIGAANLFSVAAGSGGQRAPGFLGEPDPNTNKFLANGSLGTNSALDRQLSTPMRRYSLFTSANYDITDNVTAELQGNFVRTAVTTAFGTPVPAVNQWGIDLPNDGLRPLPADLQTLLDSRPDPTADWHLATYPYFMGYSGLDVVTDTHQMSVGFKGNLGLKDWTWDVSGSIGSTDMVANYNGVIDLARYQHLSRQPNFGAGYSDANLLTGRLVSCTSGINPFLTTPVSQDCIDIIDAKLKTTTTLGQRIVEANFQGGGFSLPAGESRFAIGAGYRSNTIKYRPDSGMSATNSTSNAIGIFGAQQVNGGAAVKEIYGETDLPLLANMTAVKKLDLNLGYRFSDYDTSAGGVDTWKALLTWQVNDYVTFRGGPQRATRAANIAEMFTPPTVVVTLWPDGDLCNNFTIATYGNSAANPNRAQAIALCNQLSVGTTTGPINAGFSGLIGGYFPLALDQQVGNPEVKPEDGTTYTVGTVLRSPFESAALSGITATIDYYSVKLEGAITPISSQIAYAQCFNGNGTSNPTYDINNTFCQLIRRLPTGNPDAVIGKYFNLGLIKTSGVDLNIDWRASLSDLGTSLPGALTANLAYTKLLEYKVQVAAGDPVVDYKGSTGFDATTGAQFGWKSVLTVGYAVGPANVSLRWRHLPEVTNTGKLLNPASTVQNTDSNDNLDLFAGWKLTDSVSLRAGVENLLDKDPPILGANPPSNTGTGNTDASVYDILGRRYFVGLKAKF